MAITEHYGQDSHQRMPQEKSFLPSDSLAQLAALHEEARETAHLANLLGRTAPAFASLALLAAGALAFAGFARAAENAAWMVLILLALGAGLRAWRRANAAPFARGPLQAFAQDMNAILLYAGFAWGAGAFLVLPGDCALLPTLAFALLPAAAVGLLLKEYGYFLVFAAPLGVLCALASVLRPLPEGMVAASLVLFALVVLGAGLRHGANLKKAPQPAFSALG